MIRTILKSNKNSLTLRLPDDLVGKTIEVIAFELDELNPEKKLPDADRLKRIEAIDKALSKYRFDLSDFKFDRDEANDYE
jgi:hypothetical protein